MHHARAAERAACLAGLLLVSGLFAHADDRASPVGKQVEAARKQLVKDLHGMASWARDSKLFTWRVDVLQEILAQDPGNRPLR